MAEIAYNFTRTRDPESYIVSWTGVTESDTFKAFDATEEPAAAGAADRSVHITGTLGGATVSLQGSNDGTNFVNLTDPQGNALTSLSDGTLEAITEMVRAIKPLASGGSSQSLNVYLYVRGKR